MRACGCGSGCGRDRVGSGQRGRAPALPPQQAHQEDDEGPSWAAAEERHTRIQILLARRSKPRKRVSGTKMAPSYRTD
jgi:hypothetical protein